MGRLVVYLDIGDLPREKASAYISQIHERVKESFLNPGEKLLVIGVKGYSRVEVIPD